MSSRLAFVAAVGAVTVGVVGYAIYFDYKRRSSVDFRRSLKRQQKKAQSQKAKAKAASPVVSLDTQTLRNALEKVKTEPVPQTVEARELFFMEQLGTGEQLAMQGPQYYLAAALALYRALRVYPSPVELIGIYQNTVKPEVFKIVMEFTALDVQDKISGYYNHFPREGMNVVCTLEQVTTLGGATTQRRVLCAGRDFNVGEVIYEEKPVAAVLDQDLESKRVFCSQCLRALEKGMSLPLANDPLSVAYCSRECMVASSKSHHQLLFTLEPVSEQLTADIPNETNSKRRKAQDSLAKYVQDPLSSNANSILLSCRIMAAHFTREISKIIDSRNDEGSQRDNTSEYTLYDHLERVRYVPSPPPRVQTELVKAILSSAFLGLDSYLSHDRLGILINKMAYNAIGIVYSGGRDDRPSRPMDTGIVDATRSPYGTARQIGQGLYLVSSYLNHSCAPNTRPSFAEGTSTLHLVANTPIKKGDRLSMSYVDVSQRDGETVVDAWRRRRSELMRGWAYGCTCQRCLDETPPKETSKGELLWEDGSKVEDAVLYGIPGEQGLD